MVEAVFIGTSVPLVLLLLLLRHSRPVFSMFCWGMVSFLAVYMVSPPLYDALGVGKDIRFDAVFVGPGLEEFLKALPLFFIPFLADRSFTPYFYIFGMASGIGFAIEENLIYLIQFHEDDAQSRTLMILRSFSTCLMHGVATGFIGFMVTQAKRNRGVASVALGFLGWLLASIYHGTFNALTIADHTAFAVCLAFGVFAFFIYRMKSIASWAPEIQGTNWQ